MLSARNLLSINVSQLNRQGERERERREQEKEINSNDKAYLREHEDYFQQ